MVRIESFVNASVDGVPLHKGINIVDEEQLEILENSAWKDKSFRIIYAKEEKAQDVPDLSEMPVMQLMAKLRKLGVDPKGMKKDEMIEKIKELS